MKKSSSDKKFAGPIFIHSSFRVGSTWLWSKFRENQKCYCYYEVFNEYLEGIDFKSISHSSSSWNSGHPPGAPYFSEFAPLIIHGKGIAEFDQNMAFSDFFLQYDGDRDRLKRHKRYLDLLIKLAHENERLPVLSCTRSIGRAKTIKDMIGGTHILIKRRLMHQWFSYLNQAFFGNLYFVDTIFKTINSISDFDVINDVRFIMIQNNIRDHKDLLGNIDLILVIFISLHLFIYAREKRSFDLEVVLDKNSTTSQIKDVSKRIENLTSISIDLSDFNEKISAPISLINDIDRVMSMVRSLFVKGVPGVDKTWLREFVDSELLEFQEDYEKYVTVAGSAHQQLVRAQAGQESSAIELAELHRSAAEQIGALQEQVSGIDGELAACQADKVAMQHELQQVRDQLIKNEKDVRGRLAEVESTCVAERQAAQEAQALARMQLDEKDVHIARLSQASDEGAQKIAALENQLVASQAHNSAAQLASQQSQSRLIDDKKDLEARLAEAAAGLEQERQMAQESQELLDEREQRIIALTQLLDASVQNAEALERQLADSQAHVASAHHELQETRDRASQLEGQLAEATLALAAERQAVHDAQARAEIAFTQLNYIQSDEAAEEEVFNRKWDAMIKRLV